MSENHVPPTDTDQAFIDESQQPSSKGFPPQSFGQSSFVRGLYTMDYLPPTGPAFPNMAPAFSNWTEASDNPAQNLELSLPYGYTEYPPFQFYQQPVPDASSYPYYQNPSIDTCGNGQTGYASRATVPFSGLGHQDGVGSVYSGFSGEQTFIGMTELRDMSYQSHRSQSASGVAAPIRSSRTSTGTLRPLAPSSSRIPGLGRKQPPAKNTNNTKVPGSAVEIEYCTLELFSKWLALCEPHKRQATFEQLKDPDVRSWYRDSRWDLGAFFQWAHTKSGREEGFKLKICGQCSHTYGKFYPQRVRVGDAACRCQRVSEARLDAELELPKEQRLGLGSAKYFPEDQPQFLE